MIFFKKYKVHWQKFQKYDYYFFQLKWSLCQRTERWGGEGRTTAGPSGGGPPVEMPCAAENRDWSVLEELFFLPDWGRVKWSPGGSAVLWGCRLTPRRPQQRGTQWTLPHPTPLWLTHWLTDWLTGQRVSETADIASLVPPNRTRLTILE